MTAGRSEHAGAPPATLVRLSPYTVPLVGLTLTVLLALSLLLPHAASVSPWALAVLAAAAACFAPGVTPAGRRLWDRYGGFVAAALIVAFVAATGGYRSDYQDLFVVMLVYAAASKPGWRLGLDVVAAFLGALAPLAYQTVPAGFVTDAVVDVLAWLAVAAVARLLAARLTGAVRTVADRERRFQQLAAEAPAIVYHRALRPTSHLTYINPRVEEITGFPPEAFLDHPMLALERIDPRHHDRFLGSRRADGPVEPGRSLYRFRRADDTWVWLEDHHTPLVEDGTVVAVQGVIFDVTDRVEAEAARRNAEERDETSRAELARTLALQQGFVQAISHELRTPLTSVLGFAHALAEHHESLSPDQRAGLVDRLVANSERVRQMLDDLLDLDRLAAGTIDLVPRLTDLETLAHGVLDQFDHDGHLTLSIDVDGPVLLDDDKVRRILRNLVDNAVRHTPTGTTVACRVASRPGLVELVVEDDGPGVPEDVRPVMFEAFRQGPEALSSAAPGVGVGLALVRHFAHLHHGSVSYEDAAGGGARFVVRVRTADGPVRQTAPSARP